MEKMGPGKMDRRVAFDVPVQGDDGHGGIEIGWSEVHECAANFRYLRGTESVMAARLAGRQVVVATVRKCTALANIGADYRMRDVRSGTEFNVRSVIPSDDRAWLEVTAESGVAV